MSSKPTKTPPDVLPEQLKYHRLSPPLRPVTLSDHHQPITVAIVSQPSISALFKIQQPLLENKHYDLILKQYRRVLSFPNLLRVAPRYIHLLVSRALYAYYNLPFPFSSEPVQMNIQDQSVQLHPPTHNDTSSTGLNDRDNMANLNDIPLAPQLPPITFPPDFSTSTHSIVLLGPQPLPSDPQSADLLDKMKQLSVLSFAIPLPVLDLSKTPLSIRELAHNNVWPLSIAPKPHMAPPTIFFTPLQTLVHQFITQYLVNTPLFTSPIHYKPHWALVFDTVGYFAELSTTVPESHLTRDILPHIPTIQSLIAKHIVSFTYDDSPCDYDTLVGHSPHFQQLFDDYLAGIPTKFKEIPEDDQKTSNTHLPTQLCHCSMKAIEQTAAIQCYQFNPEAYLCSNFDLFLSHELCNMCAMAATHSRFPNIFFINQTNNGSLGSLYTLQAFKGINHRFEVYQLCYLSQSDSNSNQSPAI